MYFLRRAHEIFNSAPEKILSPSFWAAEENADIPRMGFNAAISGIEHPLGAKVPEYLWSSSDYCT